MTQLSFLSEAAPVLRKRPQEPIVRSALLTDGCRWWLKRAWGAGPMICWIMCNPSDADAGRDDPTMLRVMDFSAAWGYGSCSVVNVLPCISSTPDVALEWMRRAEQWIIDGNGDDPSSEWDLHRQNIVHVTQQIDAAKAHVAAWGNNIPQDLARRFLQDIAEMSDDADHEEMAPVEWLCLGTNSNGSPRHPLSRGKNRVPDDFKPVRWKL